MELLPFLHSLLSVRQKDKIPFTVLILYAPMFLFHHRHGLLRYYFMRSREFPQWHYWYLAHSSGFIFWGGNYSHWVLRGFRNASFSLQPIHELFEQGQRHLIKRRLYLFCHSNPLNLNWPVVKKGSLVICKSPWNKKKKSYRQVLDGTHAKENFHNQIACS